MDTHFCTSCGAILDYQDGFDPDLGYWECTECGTLMTDPNLDDDNSRFDGVAWFCDDCGAFLNKQSGFSDWNSSWICTECGHLNWIDEDEIDNKDDENEDEDDDEDDDDWLYSNPRRCEGCNELLNKQYGFEDSHGYHICEECGTFNDWDDYDDDFCYSSDPWYCEDCGTLLNKQTSFINNNYSHTCEKCGHWNSPPDDEDYDDNDYTDEQEATYSYQNSEYRYSGTETYQNTNAYRTSSAQIKPSKKSFFRRHIKGCLLAILIFGLSLYGYYLYTEWHKEITIGVSYEELIGIDYNDAEKRLEQSGFKKIYVEELRDLSLNEEKQESNKVDQVVIGDLGRFRSDDKAKNDCTIKIYYHSLKLITPPITSDDAEGEDFHEIEKQFRDSGFVNVVTEADKDLIIGLLHSEYDVESVKISGDEEYKPGNEYRPDVQVVIVYHAWK